MEYPDSLWAPCGALSQSLTRAKPEPLREASVLSPTELAAAPCPNHEKGFPDARQNMGLAWLSWLQESVSAEVYAQSCSGARCSSSMLFSPFFMVLSPNPSCPPELHRVFLGIAHMPSCANCGHFFSIFLFLKFLFGDSGTRWPQPHTGLCLRLPLHRLSAYPVS